MASYPESWGIRLEVLETHCNISISFQHLPVNLQAVLDRWLWRFRNFWQGRSLTVTHSLQELMCSFARLQKLWNRKAFSSLTSTVVLS